MTREDIEDLREQLRQSNRELVADIAAREVDIPYHRTLQPQQQVIFKTFDNSIPRDDNNSVAEPPPPFDATQVDVIAAALGMLRGEMRDELAAMLVPLRERLARCEGALVGMASSEAKATPARKKRASK